MTHATPKIQYTVTHAKPKIQYTVTHAKHKLPYNCLFQYFPIQIHLKSKQRHFEDIWRLLSLDWKPLDKFDLFLTIFVLNFVGSAIGEGKDV